jgi:nitric oxide synthase oxygenase domain/subunit
MQFSTTHWSMVLAAGRRGSIESDSALERLCKSYWMSRTKSAAFLPLLMGNRKSRLRFRAFPSELMTGVGISHDGKESLSEMRERTAE